MIPRLKNFLIEEQGQDLVEYSLLLVIIGTLVLIYLTGVGLNVTEILSKVGAMLEWVSSAMK